MDGSWSNDLRDSIGDSSPSPRSTNSLPALNATQVPQEAPSASSRNLPQLRSGIYSFPGAISESHSSMSEAISEAVSNVAVREHREDQRLDLPGERRKARRRSSVAGKAREPSSIPAIVSCGEDKVRQRVCRVDSGCRLPMHTIFIVSGLLSIVSAAASGGALYAFASRTVNDAVLEGGKHQVEAVAAGVRPQVRQMQDFLSDVVIGLRTQALLAATGTPSWSSVNSAFNRSLFWGSLPPRLLRADDLSGIEVDVLFPPTSDITNVNSLYQFSIYSEKVRNGTKTFLYQITDQSTGTEMRTFSGNYDVNDVFHVTSDNPIWVGPMDFDQFQTEMNLDKEVFTAPTPWASTEDGTPYWYTSIYRYIRIDGKYVCVAVYKYLDALQSLIQRTLRKETDEDDASHVFLYEPFRGTVVATSYAPEAQRQADCYHSYDEFVADPNVTCMSHPVSRSSFPFLRALFERTVRPSWTEEGLDVPATAETIEVDGRQLFVVTNLVVNTGALRLFLVWSRDAARVFAQVRRAVTAVTAACVGCIAVSALLTILTSVFALLRPMDRLSREMKALSEFDMSGVKASNAAGESTSVIREVHYLQTQFAAMASTIHSFSLYVPRDVVRDMLQSESGVAQLGMLSKHLVVMFVDVADFTTLCERLEGERGVLSRLLADYFRLATKALMRNGATIDKFIGDAIMCFWGAPLSIDEPELRAVCGGLEVLALCPQLSRKYEEHDVALRVRIGVNAGPCLCGNIGSEERMNYTALGDTVNTASRLESLNKEFGSSFMVSTTVLEHCTHLEHLVMRHLGSVVVKGKSECLDVYEVFGLNDRPVDDSTQGSPDEAVVSGKASDSLSSRGSFTAGSDRTRGAAETIYRRRADLITPERGLVSGQQRFPKTFLRACAQHSRGMRLFAREAFAEALAEFEAVVSILSSQHHFCSFGNRFAEFLADAERRTEQCRRGMAGELVATVLIATAK